MILLWLACMRAGTPSGAMLSVREAFDVPPPPGQSTYDLVGDHPHPIVLGESVRIVRGGVTLCKGEVVDHDDTSRSITVYVGQQFGSSLETGDVSIVLER